MTGVSAISWVNDPQMYLNTLLVSLAGPFQMGFHTLQPIIVPPEVGARNIGQAYNMALALAEHEIKVFVHQDVRFHDRHFLDKLSEILADPRVGAVGIIGGTVDTGAGFFHTMPRNKRGFRYGAFYPERCQVKLVDGFMLATKEDLVFSEEYEGPHMAIEDFCMRVRERGKQVWTLDALTDHKSGGTLDAGYWRSVRTFRRNWKRALPKDMLSIPALKQRESAHAETCSLEIGVTVVGVDQPKERAA